uniref:Uncharacterized protein n=1 Tax=Anguilla anguilla TaxID=7936 RepID=A0A0E9SRQ4_ANGAN
MQQSGLIPSPASHTANCVRRNV